VEDYVEKQDKRIFTTGKHGIVNGLQLSLILPKYFNFALKSGIDKIGFSIYLSHRRRPKGLAQLKR